MACRRPDVPSDEAAYIITLAGRGGQARWLRGFAFLLRMVWEPRGLCRDLYDASWLPAFLGRVQAAISFIRGRDHLVGGAASMEVLSFTSQHIHDLHHRRASERAAMDAISRREGRVLPTPLAVPAGHVWCHTRGCVPAPQVLGYLLTVRQPNGES